MITNLLESQQAKHSNGGGWVALTASVAPSVYVGKFAIVYDKAVLTGNVKLLDFAQVSGTSKLSGNVIVSHNAWVDKGTYSGNEHFSKNERIQSKQERIR